MLVKDFMDKIGGGTLVKIYDINDEIAYSDFLDDQDITAVEDEEIGCIISECDCIGLYLNNYELPPKKRLIVGDIWWADLSPVVGDEIGGIRACQIISKFDGYDLVRVRPLRNRHEGGFAEVIPLYETVISTDRLKSQVIEID